MIQLESALLFRNPLILKTLKLKNVWKNASQTILLCWSDKMVEILTVRIRMKIFEHKACTSRRLKYTWRVFRKAVGCREKRAACEIELCGGGLTQSRDIFAHSKHTLVCSLPVIYCRVIIHWTLAFHAILWMPTWLFNSGIFRNCLLRRTPPLCEDRICREWKHPAISFCNINDAWRSRLA